MPASYQTETRQSQSAMSLESILLLLLIISPLIIACAVIAFIADWVSANETASNFAWRIINYIKTKD